MKKHFYGLSLFIILFLSSCAVNSLIDTDGKEGRKMYYEYSKDKVWDAAVMVLKDQEWTVTEMNRSENLVKAKTSSKIAGAKIRLQLIFKSEGSGTWLEIKKKIPPQFTPGSTNKYKFDINDLFHEINIQLDRDN
jgi:hypothetical protein